MSGFSLADVLKNSVSNLNTTSGEVIDIGLDLIDEDSRNFYSIDDAELEALAGNIELVGQLDPVVVRVNPENPERYILLSGHRRCRALRMLRDEGKEQFKTVKATVRAADTSPEFEELVLIFANSNTRKMSSADLSKQTERVTELLYKLQEQGVSFPGRMRDHVAEACQISTSKLARLQAIRNNLIAEFFCCYVEGTLNESAAYSLSRLPAEKQEGLVRFKKIMNLAQKKDALSSTHVEEAIRYADSYQTDGQCLKEKNVKCSHSLERYAATICNSSWAGCRGGCCCECSRAESCSYPCKHAKAQLAEAAAERKAEKEIKEAEEADKKNTEQAVRRLRHTTQILRLAELCDRAELPDDFDIAVKSWQKIPVASLRRLAEDGLGKDQFFYSEDYGPLDSSLRGLERLAEKLKCTVGELAGEAALPSVSNLNTSPWRHDIPQASGHYLGKYGRNTEVIYFDAAAQEWRDFITSTYALDNVRAWMEIPEEE